MKIENLKQAMRVFSGIQPTGEIHIGNYSGALKQWIELQTQHECIFCIVDLHAFTVPYDPLALQKKVSEKAIAYIAAGVDPEKSIIFRQSDVKEHTELCWFLSAVTPVGDLQRMTHYKEKAEKYAKNIYPHTKRGQDAEGAKNNKVSPRYGVGVNAGLLSYPVLMAADILLYQTDLVPVGKDQAQHVELTREIARRFNKRFGETFTIPKLLLPKAGAKIMSLENPTKKMSKSDKSHTYISLFDSKESVKQKIMSAQTDSGKEIKYDVVSKPGIANLLTLYSLFSDKSMKKIEKEFKAQGYQVFKAKLAELLVEKLEPFRRKKKELELHPEFLEKILTEGAKKAQVIAQETMLKARRRMGLLR